MADRWYYLGPWIWGDDPHGNGPPGSDPGWNAPDGCVTCIDLRSTRQAGLADGTPEGLGLFVLDHELVDSDYGLVARNIDDPIGPTQRSRIGSRLGRQVTQPRLDRMLYELLTVRADPTGETFARPLMPTMARQLDIHLDGLIFSRPWRHDLAEMSAMMHQLREQYRDHRQQVLDGVMREGQHLRILDFTRKKLRIDWRLCKPSDLPNEEPLRHDTTLMDNFNRGDEELGVGNWTEFAADYEVVSNECILKAAGGNGRARFDSDLSGVDHDAQMDVILYTGSRFAGNAVRFSSSADTCYTGAILRSSTSTYRFNKWITGTRTILASSNGTEPSVPFEVKTEIDGSALDLFEDGVSKKTHTNTAIPGGVRCGIWGTDHSTINQQYDNFQTADLGVAAEEFSTRQYPRGAMRGVMRGVA